MINKTKITEAINSTKALLEDVDEPERTMSFSIVLAKLLRDLSITDKADISQNNFSKEGNKEREKFSGLTGGIRLLVSDGFFKEGKTQGEIFQELKRQGYHHSKTALPITLRSFMDKKILTRYGEEGQYRYVERK